MLYCYSPDRKAEHPKAHLAGFEGILQADGYGGLYQLGVTEAACMAHVRRKFVHIHAVTKSPQAWDAMQRIAALYAVEASIRGEAAEIRLKLRAERSETLLADLREWLDTTLSRVSGRGEMAKAIRYALGRWDALTLVPRDGRVCIDNNAAERSMTLGRRNWLFASSDCGGERAAAIFTLTETAKLNCSIPRITCAKSLLVSLIIRSDACTSCCRGTWRACAGAWISVTPPERHTR